MTTRMPRWTLAALLGLVIGAALLARLRVQPLSPPETAERARTLASPTEIVPQPRPIASPTDIVKRSDPIVSTPPPRPTRTPRFTATPSPQGILDERPDGDEFRPPILRLGNQWRGVVNSQAVRVYVGADTENPAQGRVFQLTESSGGGFGGSGLPTPRGDGLVRIIDANGDYLTLLSEAGTTFLYDVKRRGFVDPTPSVPPHVIIGGQTIFLASGVYIGGGGSGCCYDPSQPPSEENYGFRRGDSLMFVGKDTGTIYSDLVKPYEAGAFDWLKLALGAVPEATAPSAAPRDVQVAGKTITLPQDVFAFYPTVSMPLRGLERRISIARGKSVAVIGLDTGKIYFVDIPPGDPETFDWLRQALK